MLFRGKVLTVSVVILVLNGMMYRRRSADVGAGGPSRRVQASVSRVSQCSCSTETGRPAELDAAQHADCHCL